MKASEAKRISEQGREIDQQALKDAYTIIECKASVGQKHASISYNTRNRTIIKQLEDDGYTVTKENDRNEQFYLIRW